MRPWVLDLTKLTLIFFCFGSIGHTQQLNKRLGTWLNKNLDGLHSNTKTCSLHHHSGSYAFEQFNPYKACTDKICGPDGTYPTRESDAAEFFDNLSTFPTDLFDKTLPLLSRALDALETNKRSSIQAANRALKNPNLRFDNVSNSFYTLGLIRSNINELEFKRNESNEIIINIENSQAIFSKLSPNEKQHLIESIEQYMSSDEYSNLRPLDDAHPVAQLKAYFPRQEIPNSYHKLIQAVKNKANSLKNKLSGSQIAVRVLDHEMETLERLESLRKPNISDIEKALSLRASIGTYELFLAPSMGLDALNKDQSAHIATPGVRQQLQQYLSQSSDFLSGTEKAKVRDSIRIRCAGSLLQAVTAAPSRKELDVFKETIEKTSRRRFQDFINSNFSRKTKKHLNLRVRNTIINYPKSKSEIQKSFFSKLEDLSKQNFAIAQALDDPTSEAPALAFAAGEMTNAHFSQIYKDLDELCEKPAEEGEHETDSAYWNVNLITLSRGSIKHPQLGKSALSHEFAHIIYRALDSHSETSEESREKFEISQKCVSSKNPEPNKFTPHSYNDGSLVIKWSDKYLVEDWADFIEAKFLEDTDPNYYCYNLPNSNMSIHQTSSGETHSSDIYRLLNVSGFRYKKLPKECTDILTEENLDFTKQCWPEKGAQ